MPFRIFLVEDHPVMRYAYGRTLSRWKDLAVVGAVATAEELLEQLAAADPPAVDLVITDVTLPGMDGVALVERLRVLRPDVLTIVISAHEDELYVDRARRAGASACLSKAVDADTLVATIRGLLAPKAPPTGGSTPSG